MKPCIFCNKKKSRITLSSSIDHGGGWQVICDECGAMGPIMDTSILAITSWEKANKLEVLCQEPCCARLYQ